MLNNLILDNLPKFSFKKPGTNKTVWFRPILVKEEKKLLATQELASKKEIIKNISEVIDLCYENTKSLDLPTYEFDYYFVQLRIKSISEIVNAKFTCPATEEKIDLNLNLNEITFTNLDKIIKEIKINDKLILNLKPPTYIDLEDLEIDNLTYDDIINVTSKCIHSIQTADELIEIDDTNREDIKNMINHFTASQFNKILEFFDKIPQYEYILNYKTSDEQERSVKISGILDFFTLASVT